MASDSKSKRDFFDKDGYWVEPGYVDRCYVDQFIEILESTYDLRVEEDGDQVVKSRAKAVGGRNVLNLWEKLKPIVESTELFSLAEDLLGQPVVLVRGLYFDKPKEQSWSLPWHQDLSIAVEGHIDREEANSHGFCNPTKKAGTFHYQAPRRLLQRMITLRLSLDPMVPGNGPIQFIPGSQEWNQFDSSNFPSQEGGASCETLEGNTGDVFVMSPLLVHASGRRDESCLDRRRILHLEFSSQAELPAGLRWKWNLR